MKYLSILLLSLFLFMGCSTPTISDINGYKYKLIKSEQIVNNQTFVALYERIEPLNTNNWYTLSLNSQLNKSNTAVFVVIAK